MEIIAAEDRNDVMTWSRNIDVQVNIGFNFAKHFAHNH